MHLLNYNQALAYVRTRHGVGSGADAGGDLPRIELQQAFISSVVQKVNSNGLLTDIPSLLSIANTATKALTVDQGLGLDHLAAAAGRVAGAPEVQERHAHHDAVDARTPTTTRTTTST